MKNIKHKKSIFLILGIALMLPQIVAAQTEESESLWSKAYDNIIFIIGGVVLLGALFAIIRMIFDFIELQKLRVLKEAGVEPETLVAETKVPGWKRAYEWLWSVVPVGQEKNIDLGHDYDGIRELDNRLPPWWLGLMYGSIIFAAVYMYVYHWGPGDWSSVQEYEVAMEEAEEAKEIYLSMQEDAVDENNVVLVTDEASLAEGKDIYMAQCAACHAPEGGGLVGPNMTDEYWIHGGSITDLFTTIKYGVPEKGMIAWSSQLSPGAMQNVASYILTLQGTNPPNPKAAEGELYVAEEAGDSTEPAEETETESVN